MRTARPDLGLTDYNVQERGVWQADARSKSGARNPKPGYRRHGGVDLDYFHASLIHHPAAVYCASGTPRPLGLHKRVASFPPWQGPFPPHQPVGASIRLDASGTSWDAHCHPQCLAYTIACATPTYK